MKKIKRYPFNCEKHAHSIEFRINHCANLMADMECGEALLNNSEYDRLSDLREELSDLLYTMLRSRDSSGICWLTGPEIGLAKETVAWASNARADSLIAAGKFQYLQYC